MKNLSVSANKQHYLPFSQSLFCIGMAVFLFFFSEQGLAKTAQADEPTLKTYSNPAAGFSCTLPSTYKVIKTRFTLTDYSTSELLRESLRIPNLQEIQNTKESGETTNALAIECPDGSYAVVFGMDGVFPDPQETQVRIEELRRDYAQRRTLINTADAFTIVTGGPVCIDGIPATEQILSAPQGAKDTLFTIITRGQLQGRSYGIIVRAKQSLHYKVSSAARLSYLNILNNIEVSALYDDATTLTNPEAGYSIRLPKVWTTVSKRQLYDALPTQEDLQSGKKNPLTKPAGTIITDDTTFWNALVVQLPIVQIELIVTASEPRPAKALKEDIRYSLKRQGTNEEAVRLRIGEDIPVAKRNATTLDYTIARRDDLMHQGIMVIYANSRKYLIRTTAWERDMPAVQKIMARLLKELKIV